MTIAAPKSVATKTKELLKPPGGGQYGTSPEKAEKQAGSGGGNGQQHFGIRSYIHQFYDWKSSAILDEAEGWYLIPPTPRHRRLICLFRTLTVIGLLLLVAGAVGIMIGYMWPHDTKSWPRDEAGNYIVQESELKLFMDHMRPWKLAGLITFAVGGTLLAASLLIPSCARLCGHTALASDFNTPVEPPVKIFPTSDVSAGDGGGIQSKRTDSPPASPTEKMVPTSEHLQKVQPSEQKLRRLSDGEKQDAMLVDEN